MFDRIRYGRLSEEATSDDKAIPLRDFDRSESRELVRLQSKERLGGQTSLAKAHLVNYMSQ
jgi:hypothetical protein